MILVALRKFAVDQRRLLAIDGRRVTVIVSRAMQDARAVGIHPQDFRILLRHPRGTRPAGRGENGKHAVLGEVVHHPIEPIEGESALLGFERGPREDADGHRIAVRQLHQPQVFLQHLGHVQPLLGIVIAAMQEMRTLRVDRRIALRHCDNSANTFRPRAFRRVFNNPALLRQLVANLVGALEILRLARCLTFFDQLLNFGRNVGFRRHPETENLVQPLPCRQGSPPLRRATTSACLFRE